MPSLAVVSHHANLRLLDGGLAPKRGRPSAADDARLELVARRAEEQAWDAAVAVPAARLAIVARQAGPNTFRAISTVLHALARHRARWTDEDDVA